jgi:hypothetical protein
VTDLAADLAEALELLVTGRTRAALDRLQVLRQRSGCWEIMQAAELLAAGRVDLARRWLERAQAQALAAAAE